MSVSKIQIRVIQSSPVYEPEMLQVREWALKPPRRARQQIKISAVRDFDLDDAVRAAQSAPDSTIVVALGYRENEIPLEHVGDIEVVCMRPHFMRRRGRRQYGSASLLGRRLQLVEPDLLSEALRKAVIRVLGRHRYSARRIPSDGFDTYFSFRHRVWSDMEFLSPVQRSFSQEWELDHFDQHALHLGLYDDDDLVGCARLVRPPRGELSRLNTKLVELIEGSASPEVRQAFYQRQRFEMPLDMLSSFKSFVDYYRREVIQRERTPAEVSRVIVDDAHRGLGLAEALVDTAVYLAQREQVSILFLACNPDLHDLYRRSSFEPLEDIACDRFYGVGAPAIAMQRLLE